MTPATATSSDFRESAKVAGPRGLQRLMTVRTFRSESANLRLPVADNQPLAAGNGTL